MQIAVKVVCASVPKSTGEGGVASVSISLTESVCLSLRMREWP